VHRHLPPLLVEQFLQQSPEYWVLQALRKFNVGPALVQLDLLHMPSPHKLDEDAASSFLSSSGRSTGGSCSLFLVKKITRQTGARTVKEGVLRLIVSMELRLKCMWLLHRPTTPVQALLEMGMYQWLLWQIHHLNGGLILVQPDTYVLIDLTSFPCRLQQVDPC
jgi:hypothetical protein